MNTIEKKNELVHGLLPAGDYYVGDLCYVLGESHAWWTDFVRWMFDGDPTGRQHEGPVVYDGIPMSFHGTAHGDGMYEDQHGNTYPVDAGMIGCVPMEHISDSALRRWAGNVVSFKTAFDTSYDHGTIRIGHLEIETD